ncbi:ketopantoate reductase family protein [Desulfatiferula olefinivorans]
MKIAIYGAGSLGTVLGAFLARGGMDVDLINRNRAHVDGLKTQGARIVGTVRMTVPVSALLPDEMTGRYDLIFLMTKQMDNPAVVAGLKQHLKDDGVICTFQNGLPERSVADIIGEDRTFGCATSWGATLIGGGVCELTSAPESLTFGLGAMNPKRTDRLADIKRVLELMGPVEIEDNFIGARWSKLLVNCSFSGMSAVLGTTYGGVARNRRSRLCAQRIIKECFDTAKGAGIIPAPIQGKNIAALLDYQSTVKRLFVFAILPFAVRKHRRLKASMLQDLEKGKPCEIDAINGVVCAYGRRYGVPTPVNDRVVSVIRDIEAGRLSPSFDNLSLFDDLLDRK